MSGINPIKFNLHNKIEPKKEETKKETKESKSEAKGAQVNHKPATDVLDALAMQGAMNISHAKVDTGMESRIAGFMASFESAVSEGLVALEDEFGGALSESDAMSISAEMAFAAEFE